MKEFYIDSDHIRLHAKLEVPGTDGKCPLAVIFHGLTGNMEETHIRAIADAFLRKGIASLRVELYGHGMSEGKFEEHTLFKWINNVLDVIDYVKTLDFVSDIYLSGHSQGGLLTMILAGLRPDDFKAVLPLSPAIVILDAAKSGNFFGNAFDPAHIPDRLPFMETWLNGNYFRVAQMINIDELIAKYKGKVLIVHGDEDEAVPVYYGIDAADQYEDCGLAIIKGDDHCYTHHLEEVVSAVENFLDSL